MLLIELVAVDICFWRILFDCPRSVESSDPCRLLSNIRCRSQGLFLLVCDRHHNLADILWHCRYFSPVVSMCATRSNLEFHLERLLPSLKRSSDDIFHCPSCLGHRNPRSTTEEYLGSQYVAQAENWYCDIVRTWRSVRL